MQRDRRRLHKFAGSRSSIELENPRHNYDQPVWFPNLHYIFQKSVATTSNLVATIQASRASKCQYRELAAAVVAMESKSSYWRSVDLDWNTIVWTAYREQLSPASYSNISTRQASLRVYSLLEQYEEIDNNLFTLITKLRRSNSTNCQIPGNNELLSYQKLAIRSIQAAKTSTSLPFRNSKPANWLSTLA